MRGKIQVKILNQERDENHLAKSVTSSTKRASIIDAIVCSGRVGEMIGSVKFFFLPSGSLYVRNDTMYLRVKTIKIKPATKPWIVSTSQQSGSVTVGTDQ